MFDVQTKVNALFQHLTVPDMWQRDALQQLRAGRDVVVHAPTGAGKTYVFELFAPELKGQAVFTVPTRALANDKLAEWRARGWDVGISTGDLAVNLDAKIVVATLETQRARFLRREGPRLLVVDEYQLIADETRGVNYELALALAPQGTQLLLLSGSVANPQDVVAWFRRIGRNAVLVATDERPVPLTEVDIERLPGRAPVSIRGAWPRLVCNALRADLGPVLMFAPRRKAAEELAQSLASGLPADDPLVLSPEQEALAGPRIAKLLRARVAYHHSGLSYALRAGVIEPLAKNGQLRVVVATMGLAAGINFSMRSVIVTDIRYTVGPFQRQVQPDELIQMFGRAGRRGLDENGYVLFTSDPPRLADARARRLTRATQLDWPTLLAVMRGNDPFAAAIELNKRLFTPHVIPLGVEHSLETGPMPCGLQVDMERARLVRRIMVEMQNSHGEWEPLPKPTPASLGEALICKADHVSRDDESPVVETARPPRVHWRPALSVAKTLDGIGQGNLCRLQAATPVHGDDAPESPNTERTTSSTAENPAVVEGDTSAEEPKTTQPSVHSPLPAFLKNPITLRYGREFILGTRRGPDIEVPQWLREKIGLRYLSLHGFQSEVLPRLIEFLPAPPGKKPDGVRIAAIFPRGDHLVAHLDYSPHLVTAYRDRHGYPLIAPPTREIGVPCCVACPERTWCSSVPITFSPAWAWRRLRLIEPDGKPTTRGVIVSFFPHGEGLAVAAALEDETYPIAELIFHLANLRAGPRFAGDDAPHAGRLGALCQTVYERADFPGYLEMGVPPEYGAGAAEVVQAIVEFQTSRSKLLTDWLRPGDIERALIECRSVLRLIATAPDYDWPRWQELRAAAARMIANTSSPTVLTLPPLLPSQKRREP